ncbi:hypothetical protein SDC9_140403 [bioreactor metagenome]|uniref:Uncharacterized protein n=1 Tax=bioreactor metagenome TaxID=1076179 RepID=A0A645DV56_9ZZZZ
MPKKSNNDPSDYKSNTLEYLYPDTKAGKKAKKKAEALSTMDSCCDIRDNENCDKNSCE